MREGGLVAAVVVQPLELLLVAVALHPQPQFVLLELVEVQLPRVVMRLHELPVDALVLAYVLHERVELLGGERTLGVGVTVLEGLAQVRVDLRALVVLQAHHLIYQPAEHLVYG